MNSPNSALEAKNGSRSRLVQWSAIVVVIVALAAVVGYWLGIHWRVQRPLVRSQFSLPAGTRLATGGEQFALSPEGKQLAIVSSGSHGNTKLWLRSMSDGAFRELNGTETASYPFWSPDGRSIAFFAQHTLKRYNLAKGVAVTLCAAEDGRGGSWSRQSGIVFAPLPAGGLYRIPPTGGNPIQVAIPASATMSMRLPQFLPDGRHVLFYSGTDIPGPQNGVYILDVDNGQFRLLTQADSFGRYPAPGFLAFVRNGNLLVQRFDARSLRLLGAPMTLARDLGSDPRQAIAAFSFSSNGLLVYQTAEPAPKFRLTWLGLDGSQPQPIGAPQHFAAVSVSPDGRHAVAQIARSSGGFLLWLYELQQGASLRLTPPDFSYTSSIWSPDGKQLAYADSAGNLYVQVSSGIKSPRKVLFGTGPVAPTAWSPNGRLLAYQLHGQHGWDIGILSLVGDAQPQLFLSTSFNETGGTFSHDGHWFAYLSDESGRNELYVVPYPAGGEAQKISADGAIAGGWVPGLPEIAYLTPDHTLVLVPAQTKDKSLEFGTPQTLLNGRALPEIFHFDGTPSFFSADGKRLLLPLPAGPPPISQFSVVKNWTSALPPK